MKSVKPLSYAFLVLLSAFLVSCEKEVHLIGDNEPTSSFNISDIKIENYVNRLYIDIIGREPLNTELVADVEMLKENDLSREARDSIIYKLMTDTTFREHEFSYKAAYVQNLYNLAKVRCLEGVGDGEIQMRINIAKNGMFRDSLDGNWDAYYKKQNEVRRYEAVLESKDILLEDQIEYHQMYTFMIDNGVYDQINMNTFNFVRASFDELLWRLPSDQEFQSAFNMIEYNQTEELFGEAGSDKNDYIDILIESPAMFEGMIIWAYQTFLQRSPTPEEVVTLLPEYISHRSIDPIIAQILVTDEYANFE